jgi:hypothetical protein
MAKTGGEAARLPDKSIYGLTNIWYTVVRPFGICPDGLCLPDDDSVPGADLHSLALPKCRLRLVREPVYSATYGDLAYRLLPAPYFRRVVLSALECHWPDAC